MPTNRPDPKVTPERTADADATSPPDPTQPNDGSPPTSGLGGRSYPFLSPPTQPDDLGQLGPYRVVKLLGEGGMGFVFRGEDDALRRPVALKVMRPEVAAGENARERFLREGRAAAAVKSDHVITIYQVGEANGVPFLAMEFLAGSTLDDWLKSRGGVAPAAAIVKVAKDTLRGLGAAHDRGLIHRDIKPANLWLEAGTGRVKVLDFGLTRGSGADDILTREGALVGTPSYMAPEQAAGRAVDPRADLFSVGVVLYRMAAGRNPFQRGDVWATLTALAVDVPPPAGSVAAGLPAGLGALIDRLVAKNAADRPESARAALAELAEVERAMKGGTAAGVPVVNVPVVYAPPATVPDANPWAAVTESVTEYDDAPAAPAVEPAPAAARRRSVVPLAAGVLGLAVVAAGVVGLVIAMRPPAGDTATTDTSPGEKSPRPTPTPKPPEELLVPATGPEVKAGPSPFDALDVAKLHPDQRVGWRPKETVAVLGNHRGDTRDRDWEGATAITPDRKWLVAAGRHSVTVYDLATLEVRWREPNVPLGVFAVSPDGRWLAHAFTAPTNDAAHGTRLVNLTGPTPQPVKEFKYHGENGTTAIAFLADGKTLAFGTGAGHGGVYLLDLNGAEAQAPRVVHGTLMAGPGGSVRQLMAAPGRLVAVIGGSDAWVRGWDVSAAEPKDVFTIPQRTNVIRGALSPGGDRLILPWLDGSAWKTELWDVSGPEAKLSDTYPMRAVVRPFLADGGRVPFGADVFRVATGKLVKERTLPPGTAAVAPDLSRLAVAVDRRFTILDGDGKTVAAAGEEVCGPDAVPVAAGGRVYTFHPTTRAWAVKDGRLVPEPVELADDLGASRMYGAEASPDGRLVAGVGADHILRAFAVAPPARVTARVASADFGPGNDVGRFTWHPDGRRVVSIFADGTAHTWDVTTDPPTKALVGTVAATQERAGQAHLAVAPAGDVMAACDPQQFGGGVTLRRLAGSKASARVVPGVPDEYATSSQFLPDGRTLLVAFRKDNEPYRVRRYDLSKPQPAPELVWERGAAPPNGGEGMHVIQLSRDGRRVLGYVNNRVYVVDAATGAELVWVELGEQYPTPPRAQVRWADDGRHVLLGQHGCVYVLRVPDAPPPKM